MLFAFARYSDATVDTRLLQLTYLTTGIAAVAATASMVPEFINVAEFGRIQRDTCSRGTYSNTNPKPSGCDALNEVRTTTILAGIFSAIHTVVAVIWGITALAEPPDTPSYHECAPCLMGGTMITTGLATIFGFVSDGLQWDYRKEIEPLIPDDKKSVVKKSLIAATALHGTPVLTWLSLGIGALVIFLENRNMDGNPA